MNWLTHYTQPQLESVLQVLDSFGREGVSFDSFISNLDRVLSIWSIPSEDWRDTSLNRLADFLTCYGGVYFCDITRLDENIRSEAASTVAELKDKVLAAYIHGQLKQIISSLDAYEQRRVSIFDLVRGLQRVLYTLEDSAKPDMYKAILSEVVSLECSFEALTGRSNWREYDEHREASIIDVISELRKLLAPFMDSSQTVME